MVSPVSPPDAANTTEDPALPSQQELRAMGDHLYETYVKPLEREHWGEFAAVSPSGELIRGATSYDVSLQASEAFGPGNFVFKIGDRVVGRLRPRYRLVDDDVLEQRA